MYRDAQRMAGKDERRDRSCRSIDNMKEVPVPRDLFRYTQLRELGPSLHRPHSAPSIVKDYVSQHMPALFTEREFHLGKMDKVFASQWLNDTQVVYGTKCNKLVVVDVNTGAKDLIPSLQSSLQSIPASCPCGIHSIAINPSRSMLATGAKNTNDLAVYKLPTFDPVCVGEGAHTDWIFDIEWLDDEFLVTGSRDSHLGLWKIDSIDDGNTSPLTSLQVPEYSIKSPIVVKVCQDAKKVRALAYHCERKELAVLALNAYFQIWDVQTFQMVTNRKQYSKDYVCMCVSKPKNLYAIGSNSHVNLIDPKSKDNVTTITSIYRGAGIRSVSFQEDIITIGTGAGHVLFFDLKAGKYRESGCGHSYSLTLGKGWLLHDENYLAYFMDQHYPNAIFTHKYDESGTRMFVAGGPLPAGLCGNYGGLWS